MVSRMRRIYMDGKESVILASYCTFMVKEGVRKCECVWGRGLVWEVLDGRNIYGKLLKRKRL